MIKNQFWSFCAKTQPLVQKASLFCTLVAVHCSLALCLSSFYMIKVWRNAKLWMQAGKQEPSFLLLLMLTTSICPSEAGVEPIRPMTFNDLEWPWKSTILPIEEIHTSPWQWMDRRVGLAGCLSTVRKVVVTGHVVERRRSRKWASHIPLSLPSFMGNM